MPINKVFTSFKDAVADVQDGSVIFIGNFAGPGGLLFI
jgi:acyl CoA:acetate/3-ketoacid CoA transferase alpha subunit